MRCRKVRGVALAGRKNWRDKTVHTWSSSAKRTGKSRARDDGNFVRRVEQTLYTEMTTRGGSPQCEGEGSPRNPAGLHVCERRERRRKTLAFISTRKRSTQAVFSTVESADSIVKSDNDTHCEP